MVFKDILLATIVPIFGGIVAVVMYLSPVPAVRKALKDRGLGDLNPIPFVVTLANALIWGTYGLVKHDPYVSACNCLGIPIAMFCAINCFGLADVKAQSTMKLIFYAESVILPFLWIITVFATSGPDAPGTLWGITGTTISVVYYAAPLSTMVKVIKQRNSSSILVPLLLMNCANSALWTIYGIAIEDLLLWLPNGIGLVLSGAQGVVRLIYPATPVAKLGALPSDDTLTVTIGSKGAGAAAGEGRREPPFASSPRNLAVALHSEESQKLLG